jgi:hypothetical protein
MDNVGLTPLFMIFCQKTGSFSKLIGMEVIGARDELKV